MSVLRELWISAKKKNKFVITPKDNLVIIISAAVSGGASFLISKQDWSQVVITRIPFIDFIIGVLIYVLLIGISIFLLFGALNFLNIVLTFFSLVWEEYELGNDKK